MNHRYRPLLAALGAALVWSTTASAGLGCSTVLSCEGLSENPQAFGRHIRYLAQNYRTLTVKLDWRDHGVTLSREDLLKQHKRSSRRTIPEIPLAEFLKEPSLHVQLRAESKDYPSFERHFTFQVGVARETTTKNFRMTAVRGRVRSYLTLKMDYDVAPDPLKELALYIATTAAPWAQGVHVWVTLDPARAPNELRRTILREKLRKMRDLREDGYSMAEVARRVPPATVARILASPVFPTLNRGFVFARRTGDGTHRSSLASADHAYLEYWFQNPASLSAAVVERLKAAR